MPQHPAAHPDEQRVVAEHDFNFLVARHLAEREARAFAPMVGRRRDAHELLLGAHLFCLMDGMGEADALAFIDRLTENYREGVKRGR